MSVSRRFVDEYICGMNLLCVWNREIARRLPNYRGDYAPLHPVFPKDSAAACAKLDGPPASDVKDLVYTPEDTVAIEQFIRNKADSNFHPVSTRADYMLAQV